MFYHWKSSSVFSQLRILDTHQYITQVTRISYPPPTYLLKQLMQFFKNSKSLPSLERGLTPPQYSHFLKSRVVIVNFQNKILQKYLFSFDVR